MLETVRRLLGGVERPAPTAAAPEIPADVNNKAALPAFHFAFEAFPRCGGLRFLRRRSVGGSCADAQSAGVQSTFVDDTQTSIEKVQIEAGASPTAGSTSKPFSETSSDENEVQHMVDPRHEMVGARHYDGQLVTRGRSRDGDGWRGTRLGRDDSIAGAMIDHHDLLFKSPERLAEQVEHEARQEACLTMNPTNAHADTLVNRGTKRRRDPSLASPDAPGDTNEKVEFPNRSPRSTQITNEQVIYEDRQETCLPMDTINTQPGTVDVESDNPASNNRKRQRDPFEDTSEDVGQMIMQPVLDERQTRVVCR
ncbi:hypothetical protein DFH11DRAFT_1879074 [Phellopilus nigrolimitatus]|nr:hypothetical protein DFH11DRAFT_1879074 [Phellopilus nigrolimitatus]